MNPKRILVTGGNSGMGLATAGQLARLGHAVTITSRDAARGTAAQAEILERYGKPVAVLPVDMADFASIRACAHAINAGETFQVLINNAGLTLSDRKETRQGFEYQLGVNAVAPQMFTLLLLEGMLQSGACRVINISSAAHVGARHGMDWDDLQRKNKYNGQAYCQSKLALILFTRELARRFGPRGVEAYAVNPGFVSTRHALDGDTRGIVHLFFRLGSLWMKDADTGCDTTVWAADEATLSVPNGAYLQDRAARTPSPQATNDVAAARWWDLCERWIKHGLPPT